MEDFYKNSWDKKGQKSDIIPLFQRFNCEN